MIKVNGREIVWQEGITVQDLIKQLKYTYPMLIVTVNGKHIPKEVYEDQGIEDGDHVKIIHPIAGG